MPASSLSIFSWTNYRLSSSTRCVYENVLGESLTRGFEPEKPHSECNHLKPFLLVILTVNRLPSQFLGLIRYDVKTWTVDTQHCVVYHISGKWQCYTKLFYQSSLRFHSKSNDSLDKLAHVPSVLLPAFKALDMHTCASLWWGAWKIKS